MQVTVSRRPKDQLNNTEMIAMEFDNFDHAIEWMENENTKPNRIYDIAAVSLLPLPESSNWGNISSS